MRVAIIGGGIAGLSAAYELEKARGACAEVEYTLFESREKLGGSLASETVNGVVLERGPDSFLSEKAAGAELCRELGLADQLTPSNDANRKTYIVVKNRLVSLPDGLMFFDTDKAGAHSDVGTVQPGDEDSDGARIAASAASERTGRVSGFAGEEAFWPGGGGQTG